MDNELKVSLQSRKEQVLSHPEYSPALPPLRLKLLIASGILQCPQFGQKKLSSECLGLIELRASMNVRKKNATLRL